MGWADAPLCPARSSMATSPRGSAGRHPVYSSWGPPLTGWQGPGEGRRRSRQRAGVGPGARPSLRCGGGGSATGCHGPAAAAALLRVSLALFGQPPPTWPQGLRRPSKQPPRADEARGKRGADRMAQESARPRGLAAETEDAPARCAAHPRPRGGARVHRMSPAGAACSSRGQPAVVECCSATLTVAR